MMCDVEPAGIPYTLQYRCTYYGTPIHSTDGDTCAACAGPPPCWAAGPTVIIASSVYILLFKRDQSRESLFLTGEDETGAEKANHRYPKAYATG